MINRRYEQIVSIVCDFCIHEEFVPVVDDEENAELSIVWQQAESDGWTNRFEDGIWFECCPSCSKKVAA